MFVVSNQEETYGVVPGHEFGLHGRGMDAVVVHDLLHLLDEALPHGALFDGDVHGAHDRALGQLPHVEVVDRLDAGQREEILPEGAERHLTAHTPRQSAS